MHKNVVAIRNKPVERLTRRVRVAIEAMVHDGLNRRDAAAKAGLTESALYQALRRSLVRRLYNSELEVIRTSERARTIHRLVEIRDAANNMPAVNASKMLLESEETDARNRASVQTAGLAIVIVDRAGARVEPAKPAPAIEHEPAPDRKRREWPS